MYNINSRDKYYSKGKSMKKIILSIFLVSFLGIISQANQNYSYETIPVSNNYAKENKSNTLKHKVVTVPAGETFRAIFMSPLNSETSYVGQQVILALNNDFYYNNKNVAPAGSAILGTVIETSKARHGSVNGKLSIRFTQIITPEGQEIPISAIIKTKDNTGALIGGNETAEEAMSMPDRPRKGTTISAIAGSGGGLVKSIWDKGIEVDIPVNASIELILTQPITVNP